MASAELPLAVVLIAGPQASGKSTLAAALAAELRKGGEMVALVELDQIAAMALPTLAGWDAAHQIFESVTGMWARTSLTCVVAEGSGTQDEVLKLLRQVPEGAATVTVVTTTPFEVAFDRAKADPTRGISKEREFLSGVYERWAHEVTRIDPDVLIDTNTVPIDLGVEHVKDAIKAARTNPRPIT
ncbi:hypothetical protein ASF40_00905 [Microbacterium sp. Leaf288]|jgi:adenylylsulfate kinase-like enzyme|uniref:hypothetical protein n=1 Tax=Microbacterium TaxID=33882 RepID=UPI0006FAF307|nr:MULTISPECIES: hypothetical protein [Microbacterium]KQP73964.1 hypothetical protein ASF40_00905 [Microbacterium sp. Leaf288]MDR7110688.1 adenylylsulfate kinase-like enzyme [Microbacterium trichothecenolyticum]